MRVVIDTNLIISAFYNKKCPSAEILLMAFNRKIEVLWSDPIMDEVSKILGNIKADQKYYEFIKSIFRPEYYVEEKIRFDEIKDDPGDNKFLECGVVGKADYIISNDHHLFEIKNFRNIKIVKSNGFLDIVRGRPK